MTGQLATADEVIDALGGTAATARLLGRGMRAVSNWRARGRLPAETFLVVKAELERRGRCADACVFGMQEQGVSP